MAIWGRYMGKAPERIDDGDSDYLLREYRMAFGQGWKLWRGARKDEPTTGTVVDLRASR